MRVEAFDSGQVMTQRPNEGAEFPAELLYDFTNMLFLQVYLPAVEGYIPSEMLKTLHVLLNFCYIARHNVHNTTSLKDLQDALDHFHHHCKYFQQCGVCPKGFNLP